MHIARAGCRSLGGQADGQANTGVPRLGVQATDDASHLFPSCRQLFIFLNKKEL